MAFAVIAHRIEVAPPPCDIQRVCGAVQSENDCKSQP